MDRKINFTDRSYIKSSAVHSVKLTKDCVVEQVNADVLRETAMKGLSITFVSSYRRTLRTAAGRQPSPCRSLSSLPLCSSHWSLSSKPK